MLLDLHNKYECAWLQEPEIAKHLIQNHYMLNKSCVDLDYQRRHTTYRVSIDTICTPQICIYHKKLFYLCTSLWT